jgi:hypothetical protein
VAKRSSKRTGGTDQTDETVQDDLSEAAASGIGDDAEAIQTGVDDTANAENAPEGRDPKATDAEEVMSAEEAPAEDSAADAQSDADTATDAETMEATDEAAAADTDVIDAETVDETPAPEVETASSPAEPEAERRPEPAPVTTVVEKRGPGFVPLVLGGVVAAGLGYFASVYEVIPGLGGQDDGAMTEIETALAQQSEVLSALQAQVAALGEAEAPAAPELDLSPVTDQIAALGTRLDETASAMEGLVGRVSTLEERPIFSGDVSADAAAAAEAIAAMEQQMQAQAEEAARIAAEAEAAQAEAQAAMAAAEAEAEAARAAAEAEAAEAIAAAEAEAASAAATAEAEAAMAELRLAVARGEPFAEALAPITALTDVPEALSAAAETGVPSLAALQDAFPAAARAALPVALREAAGDGAMDRVAAFLQGQVGGRAIEPREGDDPDAVLSRAQAAVSSGDLETALTEIAALPEGAQAEMAGWTADAEARSAVVAALDAVAQALTGTN